MASGEPSLGSVRSEMEPVHTSASLKASAGSPCPSIGPTRSLDPHSYGGEAAASFHDS
jgi:hypothetical protein